jgi:heat shock protein HtpX
VAGLVHFAVSTDALIDRTLQMMGGRLADAHKHEEQVFKNVVDEVSVATGGKYPLEAWIIPTSAMNAFALQDFQGRSVIGITEGLLMRLNREQLEAVIGHEAGHIASGDCRETTVTSVLFKVFDNVCDVSFSLLRFSGGGRSRRGNGALPLILIVLFVAWVFKIVSVVGSLFVSRQREYRADAISARLTRNPKALAEALHIIDQRWKGAGIPGQAMEAIFILNPRKNAVDDSEDLFADLFSTHPPINKRIGILLDMAHASADDLDSALTAARNRYQAIYVQPKDPQANETGCPQQWMVMRQGQWVGPFDQATIKTLDWMTPQTQVKPIGLPVVLATGAAPVLAGIFSEGRGITKDKCPRCCLPLRSDVYEGFPIQRCEECQGILVSELDTLNILGKREMVFDQRIVDLARLTREQHQPMPRDPFDQIYDEKSIVCPSCLDSRRKMQRRFVSQKYPVEVDKCPTCARVWFDKEELEVLQVLYEMDHS